MTIDNSLNEKLAEFRTGNVPTLATTDLQQGQHAHHVDVFNFDPEIFEREIELARKHG